MFVELRQLAHEFHWSFSSSATLCKHMLSKTRNAPKPQPRDETRPTGKNNDCDDIWHEKWQKTENQM
jgi:hypothetical protein